MTRRPDVENRNSTTTGGIHTMQAAKRLIILAALAGCALLASAASASAAVPTLLNNAASDIEAATAIVKGTVTTDSALSDCHFEYVDPVAYNATGFTDLSSGGVAPCETSDGAPIVGAGDVPADSRPHLVGAEVPVPSPGAPVYYRLLATNGSGAATAPNHGGFSFGIVAFDGIALKGDGSVATDAGTHPAGASTVFTLAHTHTPANQRLSTENVKDVVVDLPPGLIGNPEAVSTRCTVTALTVRLCAAESQVGVFTLIQNARDPRQLSRDPTRTVELIYPLYVLDPPRGTVAVVGANFAGAPVIIPVRVRNGEDYGITVYSDAIQETLGIEGVRVEVWGVPADPSHDLVRGACITGNGEPTGGRCPSADAGDPRAFFTLPTSCIGQVQVDIEAVSWPGSRDSASFVSHDTTTPDPQPVGGTACNSVPFAPTLQARPTTNVGDAPTGLDVDLHIPQDNFTDPNGTVSAHLRDATVTLPEGLVVNPSGANGLDGCSSAEIGLTSAIGAEPVRFTGDPDNCPDASRVARVEVETPVLDHPLPGSVYVADPYDNPFDSLIAIYIVVEDETTGIVAKLAGEVQTDPNTGRITTTVKENPQVPFSDFHLDFFGGAGGSLRTPAICGDHTTTSTLTPWSAPDAPSAVKTDTWAITQNCSSSEAEKPHAPSFDAGTVSPIAGAYSPFVVHLRREDGSQNFAAVTVRPPLGLTAKLAGTPPCSDGDLAAAAAKSGAGEKASPSCPAASEIGNVTAGAGAGPAPYYASGKVYLAGPYKGAPISLATIIPATAGPFDLGTVVTRIAAHVNPATAEITAVSDQIPSILQGIPLDVKTVDVSLDKPDFSLNPTSCDPMAVNGLLTSTLGAVANLQSRFQLGECASLGFAPKMAIRLKGGTKRGKHPQLSAYVIPREGDANIASVSVAFPRSEFLENAHIRTICTRPDFAADNCPAGAIYGESTVYTPLLDYPLTGHVYLRSSDNLLPDVVPDLRGPAYQPIKVEAAGRTDSIRGGIRNTFDFFPDAPFSKAVLKMQGGSKGLLVNSRNICARTYRAIVKFTAHNGDAITRKPKVKAQCKNRKRKNKKSRGHKRSKRAALSARASVR